jgi:hypothetical protein
MYTIKPTPEQIEAARELWRDIMYKDGEDVVNAIAQFLAERDPDPSQVLFAPATNGKDEDDE